MKVTYYRKSWWTWGGSFGSSAHLGKLCQRNQSQQGYDEDKDTDHLDGVQRRSLLEERLVVGCQMLVGTTHLCVFLLLYRGQG